jgi:hypothetical protein
VPCGWHNEKVPDATGIVTTVMTAIGVLLAGVGAVLASLPRLGPATRETPSVIMTRLGRIRRAEAFALWSLGFGMCACLLAVGFLVLVGATTAALSSVPLRALASGAGMLAALGLGCGLLNFQQSIASNSGAVRPWRAGAGLAISTGVLAALLIAGS